MNKIKDLSFSKIKKNAITFISDINFKSISGNATKAYLNDMQSNLISTLTEQQMSSLKASRCKYTLSDTQFIGRLLMTDLQMIVFLKAYAPSETRIPLSLFDRYMDVPIDIHVQIIDQLVRHNLICLKINHDDFTIEIERTIADYALTGLLNSGNDEQYHIPCSIDLWCFIKKLHNYEETSTGNALF